MPQAISSSNLHDSHLHDHYLENGEHLISHDAKVSDIGIWLKKAWDDIPNAPGVSLFYGFMMWFAILSVFLLFHQEPVWIFKLSTFFVMLSPFLATGLYYIAQQLEQGKQPSLRASMLAWCNNTSEICSFALALGLITAAWSLATPLIAALSQAGSLLIVNPDEGVLGFLKSEAGLKFMVFFMIGASIVSAFVFSISVITLPMLLKTPKVGVINAMILSFKVVMENKLVMAAWALTIAVLLTIGLVTLGFAMLIIMPLLGYASWHAFNQLIEFDNAQ
ncbi:DUF2189 domain-containing protein [Hydrogenovibrio kuenenii]|uniref:DUF2189 domain-containing protein n=1 Tax=Hydrogenovibrio kuenenii TaxID=63658 RepID=UPI000462EC59|nr:DUF2189 domain-containing protein [Hydrogenovibrio kuenenii]